MTVRFLADENLDVAIVQGLLGRPPLDIMDVKTAGLRGTGDPALLDLAAQGDRVLITYDRHTMPRHVRDRVAAGGHTPGVFMLAQEQNAIGKIIEDLLLVWTASHSDECRNRIVYLPFR